MDLLCRVVGLLSLVEGAMIVAGVLVIHAHGGGALTRLHHGQDLGEALSVLNSKQDRVKKCGC